ncbi:MAG: flagellar export chaperone FliS [Rubrivivax sp.]
MFSSAPTMPFGRPPQFAQAYRNMAAETGIADASPHRLVAMLYDGFLEAVAEARGALRAQDVQRKGRAIGRAVRIVEEGLRAGLNLKAGGTLAADLDQLYGYVGMRLTQANLNNSDAALDECQRLLQPLRDAWMSIGTPTARHDA